VLDHDHRIGAARQRAAGGNRGRGAGCDLKRRRRAAGDDFAVQRETYRRGFAGGREIRRAHSKAVDIGAIERRHIDRHEHVMRQRAAERIGKLARLARQRAREQCCFKPRQRILARENLEKLLLLERSAVLRLRDRNHA
jgi:hypothetical protein